MATSPKISVSNAAEDCEEIDLDETKRRVKKAAALSVPGRLVRKLSGTDTMGLDADALRRLSRASSQNSLFLPDRIGKTFSEHPFVCSVVAGTFS